MQLAALDNLHASASRGEHAHVIQETFAIEMELQNLQLHLLDMRAQSYVACAQFPNALETATKMQQINPASALGYLCQGYIHMEQGTYIAACHVYDKALEHVDQHDPLYGTIQTANNEAMRQGGKRRDFMCDLPFEISARIIQQLFTHDKFNQQREYVMVSWAWWHSIIASNHLEYTISGSFPMHETSDMVMESFNHVRSLTLMSCNSPLGHLFQKWHFGGLTTLAFHTSQVDIIDQSILALERIGTQLTDLTFAYHKRPFTHQEVQQHTLRLHHILEKCPNLVSLYCQGMIEISDIGETYPRLQELKLDQVAGTVDNQHMVTIQKHLPGLNTFDLAISESVRPLTINDTWLPCIRHINYGDRLGTYLRDFDFKGFVPQGLVSLSIARTNIFSLDDIAPFIIHHHATLQVLELMSMFDTTQTHNTKDAMHSHQNIRSAVVGSMPITVGTPSTSDVLGPLKPAFILRLYIFNKIFYMALFSLLKPRTVVMNHESGEDQPNDSQLRALFAEFAKEWQNTKDAKYPLPPEVHAGLENLGSESSNELKRFQRDLVRYDAGECTQMGAINTLFIQRLKRTNLESNAIIQQRYKDADRLRATGRAATEIYEELGNIINQNLDNDLIQQLFGITEKLAKLAIFGFASAKDMDKDSKNLIAKSLKLHEYIDDNSTNKKMAFFEEDVAHIREQWNQDKLIRAAVGGKRYPNQQQQYQRGRGRGRGRGYGYRSGFGTWGSRPQRPEQPANQQQQQ